MAKSNNILSFKDILNKYRNYSFSTRNQGDKFERLMKAFLETAPMYAGLFKQVWMWGDFPYRKDLGGQDTGIDLVAQTTAGEYWAVQCKCYDEDSEITKPDVDTFITTSGRTFMNDQLQTTAFTHRLFISTTNKWNRNAEEAIQNQRPPVSRLGLYDLENAPVDWAALDEGISGTSALKPKKKLRDHQITALNNFHEHFKTHDRGKLIMACGTGKTFTSLKIAEKETNGNGLVLFLVPSIALLGQTLREWMAETEHKINPICICSDASVTKAKNDNDDTQTGIVDLAMPASTNVESIVHQFETLRLTQQNLSDKDKGMTVVFSTYQSIDVISDAQKHLNRRYPGEYDFDLIICDEAHRTTGVTLKGKDDANFVKVHQDKYIAAKKRMYMTATPRLYNEASKTKAQENDAVLCSMDDETIYGPEVYRIGFSEAVEKQLLSDYKVLVLTLKESQIPQSLQNVINDSTNEVNTDDITKLIGCINALSKRMLVDDGLLRASDPEPMHRAVAFCQTIAISKKITNIFNEHKDKYYDSLTQSERSKVVGVFSDHIDGAMSATERERKLSWLKECPTDTNECRILTNVRCLSEGVDVPSLDAVMFLSARNSQVDVVQSVGRVMRRAEGKKYGYIIIPVVVPDNVSPEEALEDNDRFKVVWTVLNALRAHDDRFNATVNKIDLNKKRPTDGGGVLVGGIGGDDENDGGSADGSGTGTPTQISFPFEQWANAIYAKMVVKVGNRLYWEQWAKDVAQIAQNYTKRIKRLLADNNEHQQQFEAFLNEMRTNLNPSVSADDVVQMLAQHLITQPIFEALFENYSFVQNNPVSKSMSKMIQVLEENAMDKDTRVLDRFYQSVRKRVEGIDNAIGKQKIIVELYEKFFKTAFPKVVAQLGIVYTPIEVVDFINNSVAHVLKKEFKRNLSDKNVHIIDPFTGTGTFITRLIQTGLIDQDALPYKYDHELWANEIVLLAYYIASINIENAYHDAVGMEKGYKSFNGICLTDTFQMYEDMASTVKVDGKDISVNEALGTSLDQNSDRIKQQRQTPITVVIGNPPYSIGQKSANDNAQNQSYPKLDNRIAETYVKQSKAVLNKGLYDSYIKAFRWASDRVDKRSGGIVAFVSNGSWIDGNSMDGFRKSLESEFNTIYVFNLRGDQRTVGEMSRKEGGKIFGSGSRTPISITILVKHPKKNNDDKATIYYYEVADYMTRDEKLTLVAQYKDILNSKIPLKVLKPNDHGDWLNQRSGLFGSFIPMEPDKKFNLKSNTIFNLNVIGVATNRDAWVCNCSKKRLETNVVKMIDFYNMQREHFKKAKQQNTSLSVEDVIDNDPLKISWTRGLKNQIRNDKANKYQPDAYYDSCYRPFFKQHLYYENSFIEAPGLSKQLFPTPEHNNLCIAISSDVKNGFGCLVANAVPNLGFVSAAQCFPLYYYDKLDGNVGTLFDTGTVQYAKRDGITDFILGRCHKLYGDRVTKEDIFYYVYGLLYSRDYRTQFAADLKKMLPRIPLVEKPADFWAFSKAGRELADLHLNYENIESYPDVVVTGADSGNFHVEKMKFITKGDKTVIQYNPYIKITNIPMRAYDYVINGKSAIEWVMERYAVTVDKASGIKNDPNDWAAEHNDPRYILNLLLSVINVSIKTMDIVDNLPKLDFK